jgi:hypothetical protein
VRDYTGLNYVQIGGITKGVTLAAATYALLQILQRPSDTGLYLLLWCVSLLACFVSYLTWGRGVLLTNACGNALDIIFPHLMGISEFFLFALLASPTGGPVERIWSWWFRVLGTQHLLAGLLVANRLRLTDPIADFEPSLWVLAHRYVQWLRLDMTAALTSGILVGGFGMSLPGLTFLHLSQVQLAMFGASLLLVIFCFVLYETDRQRRFIEDALFDIRKRSTTTTKGAIRKNRARNPSDRLPCALSVAEDYEQASNHAPKHEEKDGPAGPTQI